MILPNNYVRNLICIWTCIFGCSGLIIAQNSPGDSVQVVADSRYESRNIEDFFMGHHYRDAWVATVKVPYIDLAVEGLVPIKQGGGVQTKSLRLGKSDGTQYVFRSVKKDVSKKLPSFLHNTLAQDVVQDQISVTHPYGALVIPRLAQAAGVSHSIPRLGVIKDSPALGAFRESFAGMLVLYEQRPTGDLSAYPNYDFAPKIVNSPTVLEKTRNSLKYQVDGYAMARARLFDFWLGDIDRHEDQWRWGAFESEAGTLYRPIPRDRDFAFMKADGLIPWLATRKWAFRMAMNFDYDISDVAGLGMQGMYLDRSFLTQLTKSDWYAIADSMKRSISDSAIDEAFAIWPNVIYQLDGEEIKAKLKSRLDHLTEYAVQYYLVLARDVNILGSEKQEYFLVERLNEDETRVRVYYLNESGAQGILYFDRIFNTSETRELRLYGFGNDDEFEITGKVGKGIMIRIIGGKGADKIKDHSKVKGSRKLTRVYDENGGIEIVGGRETRQMTRKDSSVNAYDRRAYKYDVWTPLQAFGYNPDDGFYLGGGVSWKHHGFRKKPYASKHKLTGAFAMKTLAFVAEYAGTFTGVFRKWDLNIEAQSVFPHYTSNFYGLGNESEVNGVEGKNFYTLRYNLIYVRPFLEIHSKNNTHSLQLGTQYQYVDVQEEANKYVTTDAQIPTSDLLPKQFSELWTAYSFYKLDHEKSPKRGWRWKSWGGWQQRLNASGGFARLGSEFSTYIPITPLQTVVALRFGGATLLNDFEFFQANSLGGQPMTHNESNLRGYRRDRFVGRTMAYQNTEIRTSLARLPNYILPFELGLIGFIDIGRVWQDGEESSRWHSGYGGGISLSPTQRFILSITYEISNENQFGIIGMGFSF